MKFLDIAAQYKNIEREVNPAIKSVLKKAKFIGGEEVAKFEKEFARFCNVKHVISLNSGTDALFLSLKALNIGKGDEVITTPFSFISTAEVIANCGAKPIFVDIEPDTFTINPEEIERAITKKTKAIIPVHLFGQMANMEKIIKIAKKHKLMVVEDAAQAAGARQKIRGRWRMAGSVGNTGCFSFFPSKNLGAYGDGGAVTTNDGKLAKKIQLLKNHGSSVKEKYLNISIGTNSRLDTIQAEILRIKLRHLKNWNAERSGIANYYTKNLKNVDGVKIPATAKGNKHIFHQYTMRTAKRDTLKEYLQKSDIPTMIYYPFPLHFQPAFKYLGYKKKVFPEAERASREALSLPIYPELAPGEKKKIIAEIKKFFK